MSLVGKAILMWLLLLAAMFANGTLRVLALQPRLGEHLARPLAVLTGIAISVSLTFLFVRALAQPTGKALMGVGILWVVLTVAFEFLFGHYVGRASWDALLEDYDVLEGRLWAPRARHRRPRTLGVGSGLAAIILRCCARRS